ncbi:MAG TPA: 4-hydroxyphenylpyruvate dioxygenase [Herpetosiphonaceae bacterium]
MTVAQLEEIAAQPHNVLKLKYFDYVELYVGNPVQAAHYYQTVFGFTPVAYAGLETKVRDKASYVLTQGDIRLVLTGSLDGNSPIAEHVKIHGDSVKDIAFEVDDATAVFEAAVRHGARPVLEPTVFEGQKGRVIKATIAAYGDTVHSFVQRNEYEGIFFPGYHKFSSALATEPTGLVEIDHVAVGIEPGQLDYWVDFYKKVLSFHEMLEEMISTEHSAMNSKVVEDSGQRIKFPLVEPAPSMSERKSQIEEYLHYHNGAGTQHLAFLTNDIVTTMRAWQARGIRFLRTPGAYYDLLEDRVGKLDPALMTNLRELSILVDRDDWGSLMQIFTKPVTSRPTMFLELIQRNGARGFGGGNIKALFQAVEREQELRGTF